jgi:2-hydroxy-3-keto-5-methylthiopentenyl-1-phosphate phosphatase
MKTAIQIDFDGTVTMEDVSFLLLDEFAKGNWRKYLDEYNSGEITVGMFSRQIFGMVTADEKTQTDFVLTNPQAKIRPGFKEFINYCHKNNYKTLIVSNGLVFYIEALLKSIGVKDPEIHAAENTFSPHGMKVRYLGPDGKEIDSGFKEAYTDILRSEGYRVVYIGDGNSDVYPARKADHILATDSLLKRCESEKLNCSPFKDFFEVIETIKSLGL